MIFYALCSRNASGRRESDSRKSRLADPIQVPKNGEKGMQAREIQTFNDMTLFSSKSYINGQILSQFDSNLAILKALLYFVFVKTHIFWPLKIHHFFVRDN